MMNTSLVRLSAILASFLALSYTACVLYGLAAPDSFRMYPAWEAWLPGFEWISLGSYLIGLGEAAVYGVYAAILYTILARAVRRGAPG